MKSRVTRIAIICGAVLMLCFTLTAPANSTVAAHPEPRHQVDDSIGSPDGSDTLHPRRTKPVGLDAQTVLGPIRAVVPGAQTLHRVGFTNASPGPVTVWVGYGGSCTDAESDRGRRDFPWKVRRLRVPGDPARPPGINTIAVRFPTITIPSQCDGRRANDYPIDGYFTYTVSSSKNIDKDGYASWSPGFVMGWPAKDRNRRKNLLLVKDPPGKARNYQAHHRLPRKFEDEFNNRGIKNIHETQNLRWWCSKKGVRSNHQRQAREYNKRWAKFFRDHKKASRKQIYDFLAKIERHYKFTC